VLGDLLELLVDVGGRSKVFVYDGGDGEAACGGKPDAVMGAPLLTQLLQNMTIPLRHQASSSSPISPATNAADRMKEPR
jgi:hypothetical protein